MRHYGRTTIRSVKGFTLPELIVVAALIGIIALISIPVYNQWIRSADYRSTARHVVSMLRQAQSNAITTNREQRVVVYAATGQYGMEASPQSYNTPTAGWPGITDWSSMPHDVTTTPTVTIRFTPNGLASTGTGTININDSAGLPRYKVLVSPIGRINVTGPY